VLREAHERAAARQEAVDVVDGHRLCSPALRLLVHGVVLRPPVLAPIAPPAPERFAKQLVRVERHDAGDPPLGAEPVVLADRLGDRPERRPRVVEARAARGLGVDRRPEGLDELLEPEPPLGQLEQHRQRLRLRGQALHGGALRPGQLDRVPQLEDEAAPVRDAELEGDAGAEDQGDPAALHRGRETRARCLLPPPPGHRRIVGRACAGLAISGGTL
jgi:hypothetical protein